MTNAAWSDFQITFLSIVLEALPFLVLGAVVSGALEVFLPQQFFTRRLPKNRVLAIVMSSFLGLLLPMCECGIVAVMRRLLSKGVPTSCAVTYMLAAPVVNPIVIAGTLVAFQGSGDAWGVPGLGMTGLRLLGALATAIGVGLVIELLARRGWPMVNDSISRDRLNRPDGYEMETEPTDSNDRNLDQKPSVETDAKLSLIRRLERLSRLALGDFIDIAAFLVIGSALAALMNVTISHQQLESFGQWPTVSIGVFMLLAVLLSLCSEADAFVAANFSGASWGAKLGFLILGPMFDLKLALMYRWVFRPQTVLVFVPVMIAMIYVYCLAVDFFLGVR